MVSAPVKNHYTTEYYTVHCDNPIIVWYFPAFTFRHQAQADRPVGSCEMCRSSSQRAVDVSVVIQWQRSYMESRDRHTH